ncbi:MAG TPA: TonB-dependent receptor [Chthoniobacteraceae bacterium]|nr:TonB-dependent receptor [Chthoniobacteraceae bacterium]
MKIEFLVVLAACSFLFLLARAADPGTNGQQNSTTMPEVVVSGSESTLLSPDADTAAQQLSAIPGATGVVTPENFQQSRGAYLDDFIPYAAGVYIQSGQGSEDTKVSVRGSGIQSDDIAGLEVMIDGMNVNQADGEAFLQDFDLRTIKYAEIYRGADALRWGGITLGGAINFVTMTGYDAPPFEAWLSGGSYGFIEEGFLSGLSKGPNDVIFSFSNHNLDGFRDHSIENDDKLFLSLGTKIGDSAENRVYFYYGRLNQQNPASLSRQQMYADPTQTSPQSIAQDWDKNWEYGRVVDRFVVKGDDWQLLAGGYYNHRDQFQRGEFDSDTPLGNDFFRSNDFGGDISFQSTEELFGQLNRFTFGMNPTFESEVDTYYQNINGANGSPISGDRTFATNVTLYAENQHHLTKNFSVLFGAQLIYAGRHYSDRFDNPADGDQSGTGDYWGFNPKIGAIYEFNEHTQAYVNLSRSFQPPSFDESLETGDDGDELFNRLNPQSATTIEIGTRGKEERFSWDLALYRSWVKNELLDLTNGMGVPLGTVNASHTVHQGIEASLDTDLAKGLIAGGRGNEDELSFEQSFTYNDFRFSNDSTYGNNRIAGAPVAFYKAELLYKLPCGLYFGPNLEWNVSSYPADEANTLFADPYALLGFRAGYKSPRGLEVFFEAKNLTNKIYAATVEAVGNATSEGGNNFNPGVGRAFYGGVSWKW